MTYPHRVLIVFTSFFHLLRGSAETVQLKTHTSNTLMCPFRVFSINISITGNSWTPWTDTV